MSALRELMVEEEDCDLGMEELEDGASMIDSAIAELGVTAIQSSDPDFVPGSVDILISECEAQDSLAFLNEFNPEQLALKNGEARTYILPDKDEHDLFSHSAGSFQVFVADVGQQPNRKQSAGSFLTALGSAAQEMFKTVAVKLHSGTALASHTLIMAGRAKDLGLAREAFADAMALAGFDVSWRGYVRNNTPVPTAIEEKLASYGFSFEGTTLAFKAIAEIPSQHRAEAAKVVLSTLAEDLSSLNRVIGGVRQEMRQRKEYGKVQRILDMHDISEEGLYYLLTKLENTSKLDPKGDILPLLRENREFLALAEERVQLFSKAIEVTVSEARQNGLPPEQITDIIEKNGLTLKSAGQPLLKLLVDQDRAQGGKIMEMRSSQP